MTNFEHFKSLSREELIKFFNKISTFEDYPWEQAFSPLCLKCMKENKDKFLSCEEIDGTCKYFPHVPTNEDLMNWWFDQEYHE